jgi:hypothetical protein
MDFKEFKSEMERKNADKLRTRLRKYEKAGVDPFEAVAANIVGSLRTKSDRDLERLLALLQENEEAYNAAVREAYNKPSRSASSRRRLSPRTRRAHGVLKKAMRARHSRKNRTARKPWKQGSTTILSINVQPARPIAPNAKNKNREKRGTEMSIYPPPPNTHAVKFGPMIVYYGNKHNDPPMTKKEYAALMKEAGFTEEEH